MRKTQQIHNSYSREEIVEAYQALSEFYAENGLKAGIRAMERLYKKNKLAYQLHEARKLDLGERKLNDVAESKRKLFQTVTLRRQ